MSEGDGQETEYQQRQRLYASTRAELLERQFSNSEEYDKAILTFASGFLAASLGFIKDLLPAGQLIALPLLYLSWSCLAVAILSTVVSFLVSNNAIDKQLDLAGRYYLQGDNTAYQRSNAARAVQYANYASGITFFLGIALTVGFGIINFPGRRTVIDSDSSTGPTHANDGQSVPTMQRVVPSGDLFTKGQTVPQMQPLQTPTSQATPAAPPQSPAQGGSTGSSGTSSSTGGS